MVHECEECGYEMDQCGYCYVTLCHDCFLNGNGLCKKCAKEDEGYGESPA